MITHHFSQPVSRGFTLMETIMYIALFSILMTGAVVAAYNLVEGASRNNAAIEVEEEGTFLDRKINWALTGATAVSASSDGTALTITRPDLGSQSPLVITSDGTMMSLKRGIRAAVELNNDRFTVTSPTSGNIFSVEPAVNGRPPSVTVSFEIEGMPFFFRTYVRQ